MLISYLKIAWRHVLKKKEYTFINIVGLGIGMACCALILLYVHHEFSYDQYHNKLHRTYRVLHGFTAKNTANPSTNFQVWGSGAVAPALLNDFPEVETVFRFTNPESMLFQYEGKRFQEEGIIYGDSTAFDMFDWKLLAGDPRTALTQPYSVVLTEKLAKRYFDDSDPLGKTITLSDKQVLRVTGVMENVPPNSHFTFDGIISMQTYIQSYASIFEVWDYVDFYTYFTLREQAEIASMREKADAFAERYTSNWANSDFSIQFEPMENAYLHSDANRPPGPTGNLQNLYILSSVAVFILLLAGINFVNLSTSRSLERAKEVGIRKVVGALRQSLSAQFLIEFMVLTLLAFCLAVILTLLALPYLQEFTGKPLSFNSLQQWAFLPLVIAMVLLLGTVAGIYPATILVKYDPVKVLKGSFASSREGSFLRKSLVTFQFALSIALMVGTGIVFTQLQYLTNFDLGFEEEQMLIVDFVWDEQVLQQREAITNALLKHPQVLSVGASRAVPGDDLPNAGTAIEGPDGTFVAFNPTIYEIDDAFIQNYQINMRSGRAFSPDFPNDSASSLIINEAAARLWGYENTEDIIGKKFSQWGKEGTIIGVSDDFHYQSLHQKVAPLSMRYEPMSLRKFSIRIKPDNIKATLADLERLWNDLVPHRPFLYHFLDDAFHAQYQADTRFGRLFAIFAGLAIFIACLGLFGLTAYDTSQRTKEIGIRKVLGASAIHIVLMLSGNFFQLFAIASLIAAPIAWYGMNQWLQSFPYKTDIAFAPFAMALVAAIAVAFTTIGWLAFKAAFANPVDALKDE